ncbi:MAG: NAD(+) diphosphatase [Spirochaetaceae bacterium]|jgi:NAD+ diphosphatase|nr:NAD(+) diphosphatase [Spirochaetaceae bacterium]
MSVLPLSHSFIFRGSELMVPSCCENRRVFEGTPVDAARAAFNPADLLYFEVPLIDKSDVIPCFSLNKNVSAPAGWRCISARVLAAEGFVDDGSGVDAGLAAGLLSIVFRACHIAQWVSDSVFCGSCGGKNNFSSSEFARVCTVCGRIEYPRVSPAIIVRISNDNDEILLAHDRKFSGNVYSLIAGFYEAGECLEDTVEREVFEEVGLRVRDVRFISSQSWPFPNSLMVGFSAKYAGGFICCDGVEIEDAGWFNRGNLPQIPGHGSIARRLIEEWRRPPAPASGLLSATR